LKSHRGVLHGIIPFVRQRRRQSAGLMRSLEKRPLPSAMGHDPMRTL
jgi:hypothetical protein